MSPWEVIEEALLHKRPVRDQQWLAEQLGVSAQVVSNWKSRGVPARRYRDISSALGITLDQLEGLEPLPWLRTPQPHPDLSESALLIATQVDALPKKWREWAITQIRSALDVAQQSAQLEAQRHNQNIPASSRRSGSAK